MPAADRFLDWLLLVVRKEKDRVHMAQCGDKDAIKHCRTVLVFTFIVAALMLLLVFNVVRGEPTLYG